MKRILFISIFATAFLFACNNAPSGAHTQDDGTAHTDCDHDHEKAAHTEQESFEVKDDSTKACCKHDSLTEAAEHETHQHDEGDDHGHSH